MALCWPLQMPPTQKSVLVSLADNANDQGHCWPSIDTICERTCLGRTSVIDAIKQLEIGGHISADRSNGRKTSYMLHPNQSATRTGERPQTSTPNGPVSKDNQYAKRTGTGGGPVREADQTSPPRGPNQSATRTLTVKNRQEPSEGIRPRNVPDQVWRDFVAVRKTLRAPITETSLSGIEREAAKAGMSLPDALRICCERSWRGFKADWLLNGPPARASPTRADRLSATVAALTGRQPKTEIIDVVETATVRLG